jgi:hypothetical protein
MRVHHRTQLAADVVTVAQTGETLTVAAFQARYPRGLLIERLNYANR